MTVHDQQFTEPREPKPLWVREPFDPFEDEEFRDGYEEWLNEQAINHALEAR